MDLDKEIDRGERARRILNDELFNEAFQLIRTNLLDNIENLSDSDERGVLHCKRMLHATNEVRRFFTTVMETGKMAKIQMEQKGIKKMFSFGK